MSHILDLIKRGDAATITAIREACSRFWGSALDGSSDADDLVSEAVAAILNGDADTITDAARIAYNALRRDRIGGVNVGMEYFSQTITDGKGEPTTVGERLAETIADRSETGRDPYAEIATLARIAGQQRVRKGYAAHGAVMARGEANALRGALNDADVLRALEAVGGRRYGYAAAMVRWFAAEGIITTANAVRVAVHRALARTEGGHHSDRC
jgi:hypothetical protein